MDETRAENLRQAALDYHEFPKPGKLEVRATKPLANGRDLARAYSDEKVGRARAFLTARQSDADLLAERIKLARMTCDELRRWLQDVEAEERQAQTQIKRLEADLKEILPTLGYDFDLEDHREQNVVQLPKPGK